MQSIEKYNQTFIDYNHSQLIHELFEAQVLLAPANIALIFKDKKITYDELNTSADRLARCIANPTWGPNRHYCHFGLVALLVQ